MIETERVIAYLQDWIKDLEIMDDEQEAIECLNIAIQALRAQQNQGWISVEDRLPEYGQTVLIFANNNIYTATLYKPIETDYWAVNNRGNVEMKPDTKIERVRAKAIKFWQPLPEPPKGEGE